MVCENLLFRDFGLSCHFENDRADNCGLHQTDTELSFLKLGPRPARKDLLNWSFEGKKVQTVSYTRMHERGSTKHAKKRSRHSLKSNVLIACYLN